jgi:hypothetical protein
MANIDGQPDHAAPPMRTVGWSPKALFGALAAVLAPLALAAVAAIVEVVSANPTLFDGLPAPVTFAINVVVSGLGALFAARKASPGTVVQDS